MRPGQRPSGRGETRLSDFKRDCQIHFRFQIFQDPPYFYSRATTKKKRPYGRCHLSSRYRNRPAPSPRALSSATRGFTSDLLLLGVLWRVKEMGALCMSVKAAKQSLWRVCPTRSNLDRTCTPKREVFRFKRMCVCFPIRQPRATTEGCSRADGRGHAECQRRRLDEDSQEKLTLGSDWGSLVGVLDWPDSLKEIEFEPTCCQHGILGYTQWIHRSSRRWPPSLQ